VQALNNGQVDALSSTTLPPRSMLQGQPRPEASWTPSYAEGGLRHRRGKGNTALLDAINGALEELKADGTLQAIVDKYITAE
jgi:ABC-type amino acid transport substrate-binding protein